MADTGEVSQKCRLLLWTPWIDFSIGIKGTSDRVHVAGPRTEAHWDDYVKALDCTFTREDEDFIDSLVVAGHAAAPGYNDPQYPIEGRVARTS